MRRGPAFSLAVEDALVNVIHLGLGNEEGTFLGRQRVTLYKGHTLHSQNLSISSYSTCMFPLERMLQPYCVKWTLDGWLKHRSAPKEKCP